ncbi:MAG: methylenetetrahydrofolate reductase [NAD(P)H] [Gemmataceae bacterium]|nr:methylenetetrahydrofolate reductase [NAD(P)H] [Gemmataceae bacterium]
MAIPELYASPETTVSFEFFPPKTEQDEAMLFRDTVPGLVTLKPAFVSVTYGAGGGTRGTTLRVAGRLKRDFGIEAMPHVTCSGSTREMISNLLDEITREGFTNVLALRGDPPKGETEFQPTADGFSYAVDLVRFIKDNGYRFRIGCACYPEGHVECGNKRLDWDRTADKVEAGAEFLLSQLFYNVEDFLEFEDYLRNKRGVQVPIIPGILPFLSTKQIKRFTSMCGCRLADGLVQKLDALAHDDESVRKLGVEVCTDMCRRLIDHGVPGIHVYCLNRTASASELMRNLGLPKPTA